MWYGRHPASLFHQQLGNQLCVRYVYVANNLAYVAKTITHLCTYMRTARNDRLQLASYGLGYKCTYIC